MDWFDVWDTVNQLSVGKVRTRVVWRGWASGNFLVGVLSLSRAAESAHESIHGPPIGLHFLVYQFSSKESKLCNKHRTLVGACAAYLGVPRAGICN